jgi:hypothetical protein
MVDILSRNKATDILDKREDDGYYRLEKDDIYWRKEEEDGRYCKQEEDYRYPRQKKRRWILYTGRGQYRSISQKVTGLFRKRHIYCKYTETKLILIFNVNPIDFNASVPAFHKFLLIPSERKIFGCVFNQFCTAPVILHRMKIFFLLDLLSSGQKYGNR